MTFELWAHVVREIVVVLGACSISKNIFKNCVMAIWFTELSIIQWTSSRRSIMAYRLVSVSRNQQDWCNFVTILFWYPYILYGALILPWLNLAHLIYNFWIYKLKQVFCLLLKSCHTIESLRFQKLMLQNSLQLLPIQRTSKTSRATLICNQKAFWPMAIIYVEDLQVTQNEMKFDFQNQNWTFMFWAGSLIF